MIPPYARQLKPLCGDVIDDSVVIWSTQNAWERGKEDRDLFYRRNVIVLPNPAEVKKYDWRCVSGRLVLLLVAWCDVLTARQRMEFAAVFLGRGAVGVWIRELLQEQRWGVRLVNGRAREVVEPEIWDMDGELFMPEKSEAA